MTHRLHQSLVILDRDAYTAVYGSDERAEIARWTHLPVPHLTAAEARNRPELLGEVEAVFSGWGGPVFDTEFLDRAPKLQAVFYAAGSVRAIAAEGLLFERGVRLVSSLQANAIPVAEFCLSQILFSLKLGWHFALDIRRHRRWPAYAERGPLPGACGGVVGLISLGAVSRKLIELLKPFGIRILVASNYLSLGEAVAMGVELAEIDDIFSRADVVSLHSPGYESRVVRGHHLLRMKPRATFLNTARGNCVDEAELIDALKQRPDLIALLDVTNPEPPEPNGELLSLPNIVTFPHISGSLGAECRRMARYALDDFHRFRQGLPLLHEVTHEQWKYLA